MKKGEKNGDETAQKEQPADWKTGFVDSGDIDDSHGDRMRKSGRG